MSVTYNQLVKHRKHSRFVPGCPICKEIKVKELEGYLGGGSAKGRE
jgi:hypothetical protein